MSKEQLLARITVDSSICHDVKAISIWEAEGQFGKLTAQACRGETIVLTDGDRRVTLAPGIALDLEADSPELESELLKAVDGSHTLGRSEEFREITDKALREHRASRQK